MQIKVMPFLRPKGNRVAKAAIEFGKDDYPLEGFQLVGFTICDDREKGLFVLFPSSIVRPTPFRQMQQQKPKPYFFLLPTSTELLDTLQDRILDIYESMTTFQNNPRRVPVKDAPQVVD